MRDGECAASSFRTEGRHPRIDSYPGIARICACDASAGSGLQATRWWELKRIIATRYFYGAPLSFLKRILACLPSMACVAEVTRTSKNTGMWEDVLVGDSVSEFLYRNCFSHTASLTLIDGVMLTSVKIHMDVESVL